MAYDTRARTKAAAKLAPIALGGSGQAVTLTAASGGGYSPATGKRAGQSTAAQTGSGIEDSYSAREIDGSTVLAGDKRFMLSALASDGTALTMPAPGDLLEYGTGARWRIMAAEPYAPAGLAIYAMLHLRGV